MSVDSVPVSRVEAFFKCLADDPDEGGITGALARAKISSEQFKALLESDEQFFDRFQQWDTARTDALVDQAYKAARHGDTGMQRFLLTAKHPLFRPEKKGQVNLSLTTDDLKKLSDDELAELKRRCQA